MNKKPIIITVRWEQDEGCYIARSKEWGPQDTGCSQDSEFAAVGDLLYHHAKELGIQVRILKTKIGKPE